MGPKAFHFDMGVIEATKEKFVNIQLSPRQQQILDMAVQMVKSSLNLPEETIRGYCLMAARQWQVDHKKTLVELGRGDRKDRPKAMMELALGVLELLAQALENPDDKEELKNTLIAAYWEYLENYY